MKRLLWIAGGAVAGAAAMVVFMPNANRPATTSPPTSFAATTTVGPLPVIPPIASEPVTLLKPYVGDKDSIIERYRPAFHAMGYEIGVERTGVVGDKILYHWWAQRRFEQEALLPQMGGAALRANPYGQPESEAAVKALLAQVKAAEARK